MIKKKSQVSVEFLFVIGVVIFIFIILLAMTLENRVDIRDAEHILKKRAECLRLSNLISEIYNAGHGTEISTKTNYIFTVFNTSLITIEDIENATFTENKIAFLVSNCGPSLTDEDGDPDESLFHTIDDALNPDWYHQCYSACENQMHCSWFEGIGITADIEDLMDNADLYDTIYLEDPTMDYQYRTTFENWIKQGKVLVASEHLVCHSSICWGSSHNCGGWSDTCNIFGVRIHQETSPKWGHEVTVENVPDEDVYNLAVGEKMEPEENSWIEEIGNPNVSGFEVVARYTNRPTFDSYLKPAILQWNYGNGRVYYFNDFQVNMFEPGKDFTNDVLVNLIEKAYYSLVPKEESDVTCTTSAKSTYSQLTGDIKIRNDHGIVLIENETAF